MKTALLVTFQSSSFRQLLSFFSVHLKDRCVLKSLHSFHLGVSYCPLVSLNIAASSKLLGFAFGHFRVLIWAQLRWESSQIRILLWDVQQLLSTVSKLFLVHDTEEKRATSHWRTLRSLVCVYVAANQTKKLPCLLIDGCMMESDCMLTLMVRTDSLYTWRTIQLDSSLEGRYRSNTDPDSNMASQSRVTGIVSFVKGALGLFLNIMYC